MRAELTFIPVDRVEDVLNAALREHAVEPPVAPAEDAPAPITEQMSEGVHFIDESTPVPEEEPVEVNEPHT